MNIFSEFGLKVFGKQDWEVIKFTALPKEFIDAVSTAVVIENQFKNLTAHIMFKTGAESFSVIEKRSTASLGDTIDLSLCILLKKKHTTTNAEINKIFIADSKETFESYLKYYEGIVIKK